MLGELLGEWMRLTGSGTISLYRQKAIWLAGTANVRLEEGDPGRWLRELSDRGYLEVDWDKGRWSCSPLALTRLPSSDGLAVLAGFPPPSTMEALGYMDVDVHKVDSAPPGDNALARPGAIFIQYDSIANLRAAAARIGAAYVPCSAWQLADKLATVALGPASAPPNTQNETLAYYDATRLSWFAPPTVSLAPGLYRYEGNGRSNFLWYEYGDWRHCEMSAGIWTALARSAVDAIRWRPCPDSNPNVGVGTVFTDFGAPLPALHRRCLVLCSGFGPKFNLSARTASYDNVPRGIADVIWLTLGQRPHVLAEGD